MIVEMSLLAVRLLQSKMGYNYAQKEELTMCNRWTEI